MTVHDLSLLKTKALSALHRSESVGDHEWLSANELKCNLLLCDADASFIEACDPSTFLEVLSKAVLYEKLRRLNPKQFQDLRSRNIKQGIAFDELVNAL